MPSRRDLLIAAALAAVTWASRLPYVGAVLYHWDSINFALALQRFDLSASQPHPPGYLLYVLLGRLFTFALPDPQQALAAISVLSSGLAVGALYLLGVEMFGAGVGLAAALLLASSPLFWFYGAIALPHCLDALAVIVTAWLLWRVARGDDRFLLPGAVWLGIAGGMRPQTEVFLAPLVLYAVFSGVRGSARARRRALVALAALVVVDLLWFVPLTQLSGGVDSYRRITEAQNLRFNTTTSLLSGAGLWGMRRNALKLGMYTLYGWGAGLPLLALGGVSRRRWRGDADPKVWLFLLAWVLPSLAFYQFIHMGQQGLVFVFLPALLLASAAALTPITGSRWIAVAAAVLVNAGVFLLAPTYPLGGDRPKLLTADTLRQHDQSYTSRFAAIRSRFDPHHTVVVSAGWRFPQYYLGDYKLVRYGVVSRWELGEGESQIKDVQEIGPRLLGVSPDAGGGREAVILDDELLPFVREGERLEWVELEGGGRLAFLRLREGEGLRLGDSISIAPPRAEAATP